MKLNKLITRFGEKLTNSRLFNLRRQPKRMNASGLNGHLLRDIGLENINSERRVDVPRPVDKGSVTYRLYKSGP